MFLPVDSRAFIRLTILPHPILCAFVCVFLSIKHLKSQSKRRPRGRLHSDAQVSVGLGNTKAVNCKTLCV